MLLDLIDPRDIAACRDAVSCAEIKVLVFALNKALRPDQFIFIVAR